MFGKRKIATLVAEFLGTGALTLLILSVQRSTIGVPFFVAMAAAITVALMMFVFGGISGGYFNPAITFGLWTTRKIAAMTAILYLVMQFLGGWSAYALYKYFANTSLQAVGGHYTTRILISEAVGASIFGFAFAAAVYNKYNAAVTASFVGVAYMVGIVLASTASIGLLNPAVALGDRAFVLWTSASVGTWGTYFAGPIIGAFVGINLYDLLFAEGKSQSFLTLAFSKSSSSSSTKSVSAAVSSTKKSSSSRAKAKK